MTPRNYEVTTIAPTGTISLVAETSSGIEPNFSWAYVRRDTLGTRTYVHSLAAQALGIEPADVRAARGRGCVECNQKGYRGRVAIYEMFLLDETITDLIQPGLKTGQLREAARKLGWRSMREYAWKKVQRGVIPIGEQDRWTRLIDPAVLRGKNPPA